MSRGCSCLIMAVKLTTKFTCAQTRTTAVLLTIVVLFHWLCLKKKKKLASGLRDMDHVNCGQFICPWNFAVTLLFSSEHSTTHIHRTRVATVAPYTVDSIHKTIQLPHFSVKDMHATASTYWNTDLKHFFHLSLNYCYDLALIKNYI